MRSGYITDVSDESVGSELAAAATTGETALELLDSFPFPDEGSLRLVDEEAETEEVVAYSAIDRDTHTVTLSAPLAADWDEETPVLVDPEIPERVARVRLDEAEGEPIDARVPYYLWDRIPEGTREAGAEEAVVVESDQLGYYVADVLGQEPSIATRYLDTSDGGPPSDGEPPSASPTPTVAGFPGGLWVRWSAVANTDPVHFEVHVIGAAARAGNAAWEPDASTLAGEVYGSRFIARQQAGVDLAHETDYWVKLVEIDADGAAPAGNEAGPIQVGNAADDIEAGTILAEHLEAILVLVSQLIAGTEGGARIEHGVDPDDGFIGVRAYRADGTTVTFSVDAQTGDVYIKGVTDASLVTWPTDSRLMANDIVEIRKQVSAGFQTPSLVQSSAWGNTSATWLSPTTVGNLLLMVAIAWVNSATIPTINDPAGWGAPIVNVTRVGTGQSMRMKVWAIPNSAAARSGAEAVTFSGATDAAVHVEEWAGVGAIDAAAVTNSGTGFADSVDAFVAERTVTQDATWFALGAGGMNGGIILIGDGDFSTPWTSTRHQGGNPGLAGMDDIAISLARKATVGAGTISPGGVDNFRISERFSSGTEKIWVTAAFAYRAKAASAVPTPAGNKVRYYAIDVNGRSAPAAKGDDGVERELAAVTRAAEAYAAGSSTRANNAYGNLADGVTTSVTVDVGPSGMVEVDIGTILRTSVSNSAALIGIEVSGANVEAAGTSGRTIRTNITNDMAFGRSFLYTGLNPGATTFTLRYSTAAGTTTGTFAERRIKAKPL